MVTLHRVSMVVPTTDCIYAPSRIDTELKRLSECEFLERYADGAQCMLVSFEDDGFSNPQRVTAYGYGLDCWWIVVGGAK